VSVRHAPWRASLERPSALRPAGAAPCRDPALLPARVRGLTLALAVVLMLVLALRLLLMRHTGAGLHVDEAQYWLWSRELQWGYHSKPPGIAALIAWSTALWGDEVIGVRALAMACHPLAAAVLWRLAHDSAAGAAGRGRDSAGARRAGHWALALFLCSPLSGLLGLVATTDAPLLLCWSVALLALWHLVQGGPAGATAPANHLHTRAAGIALALAVGLGLLSKYTMVAFLPGALAWAAWAGGAPALRRVALALGGALLVFAPHLGWNLASGMATWQHTVASTVDVAPPGDRSLPRRVAELLAAQWLLFGPVAGTIALSAALGAWRRRPPHAGRAGWAGWADRAGGAGRSAWPDRRTAAEQASGLLWFSALPLLLAGLSMAVRGRFEVNWIAPLHLMAALALGRWLAAAPTVTQRRSAVALGLQALLVILLAALPALVQAWRPGHFPPPALDAWARMRGWNDALDRLRPSLPPTSGDGQRPRILGSDRHLLAHTAWRWRDLHPQLIAADVDGRPDHHFERVCPWQRALRAGESALLLSQAQPPARWATAFDRITPLADVQVERSAGRRLTLRLALGTGFRPDAAVDDPRLLPAPDDHRRCP
jgi:4-amino-4-deoxy-L-arabinose transferase-like glycosyltransferase